ncbi:maltose/moltooligosaccharide transporter [Solimonas aquatica]|uniref:Maltose/moltooligosaccharide transporter n=1 Tax=Solimonas aquatica TaxID=489703 RepID=A0A1H9AQ46_9GAMM|nr:MFS transporter [Solimonas aquatica]SEP78932.1 maltose/moltooligosaccharide transporter [Solimonas aquatica]
MSLPMPPLRLRQILSMNLGFFGIQYSFGLQQANMSPLYRYLGADEASLPYLWLAGPMTGLLVQPIIGALSDRNTSRLGRRTPYFLIGAILCSLCLLAMPFSPTLWAAAGLLWLLDAGNNITMEPYRAFVSDRLPPAQRPLGFLTQSAFTGLGQTLAYLTPSLLVLLGMPKDALSGNHIPLITYAAFMIGAVISIVTILWTVRSTPEPPLSAAQLAELRARASGLAATLREVFAALREMPPTMRQLAPMMLCQWYAMFCYWQYITLSLARTLFDTGDAGSAGFREAGLITGQIGAFYNFVAFLSAFALARYAQRFGARSVHSLCLLAAGIGMWSIPAIHSQALLLLPMACIGLAWASIMGNPYVMLADSLPPQRTGVYMGIFNLYIVIPMLIQIFTLPLIYHRLLDGDPRQVIRLAGLLMLAAAACGLLVRAGTPSAQLRGA